MSSGQERSEKPTDKRIQEARDRGQIAKSREFNSLCVLIAGALGILFSGDLIQSHFQIMLKEMWGDGFQHSVDANLFMTIIVHLFIMIAPAFLCVTIAAVASNSIQVKGFSFSLKALKFDISNLSPLAGIKRLISLRSLTELIKSIIKFGVIGYAVYSVLKTEQYQFLDLIHMSIMDIARQTCGVMIKVVTMVIGVMVLISLADFLYQKWQHQKELMMTKQEVKEESKQSEGNPQIKSRIRSLQRALVRQRMMAKVPKATVIVTNPTHFAVALTYKQGMEAPIVVAKGMDLVAQKIIKLGRKHGVPVVQNPPLARALYKQVKLDASIPLELYKAVAKILAYVFQQQQKRWTR